MAIELAEVGKDDLLFLLSTLAVLARGLRTGQASLAGRHHLGHVDELLLSLVQLLREHLLVGPEDGVHHELVREGGVLVLGLGRQLRRHVLVGQDRAHRLRLVGRGRLLDCVVQSVLRRHCERRLPLAVR